MKLTCTFSTVRQSLSYSAIYVYKKRFDFFQAVYYLYNYSIDQSINVESSLCEPCYERQTLLYLLYCCSSQSLFPIFPYYPFLKSHTFLFVALADKNPQQRALFGKYHMHLT